jgi:hypothetical protein
MTFTPYDAGIDTIRRARAILAISDGAGLSGGVSDDLRRLAVVMAVAALDTYMHRLVVTRAYEHDEMPGGLAALSVTFGDLVAQAETVVAARKKSHNIRPKVRAKRILRERLSRETFQRSEDVSRALGMAGKSGKWQDIADAMSGSWSSKSAKEQLDGIVDRRNAIVHEGDYERSERPRDARTVAMTRTEASDSVELLADLIEAIHSVISA